MADELHYVKAVINDDTEGIFKGSAHAVPPDLPPAAHPTSTDVSDNTDEKQD